MEQKSAALDRAPELSSTVHQESSGGLSTFAQLFLPTDGDTQDQLVFLRDEGRGRAQTCGRSAYPAAGSGISPRPGPSKQPSPGLSPESAGNLSATVSSLAVMMPSFSSLPPLILSPLSLLGFSENRKHPSSSFLIRILDAGGGKDNYLALRGAERRQPESH